MFVDFSYIFSTLLGSVSELCNFILSLQFVYYFLQHFTVEVSPYILAIYTFINLTYYVL